MTWIKENLQATLLLCVLIFQAGTLYASFVYADKAMSERVAGIETRITHAESDLAAVTAQSEQTYQRRDVLETRLSAIEFRLGKIEAALDRLRP